MATSITRDEFQKIFNKDKSINENEFEKFQKKLFNEICDEAVDAAVFLLKAESNENYVKTVIELSKKIIVEKINLMEKMIKTNNFLKKKNHLDQTVRFFFFKFSLQIKRMDFILNEALEDDYKLGFSDEDVNLEEKHSSREGGEVLVYDSEEEQDASFYRSIDNRFQNQTINSQEMVDLSEDKDYGEDDYLPELFNPEIRENVLFDNSDSTKSKSSI